MPEFLSKVELAATLIFILVMVLVRQVIEVLLHTTTAKIHCALVLLVKSGCVSRSGQMGLGTNNPVQQSGTGLHIHNAGGQTRIKLTNNITGATANDGFDIIQEHNNDVHILNHELAY